MAVPAMLEHGRDARGTKSSGRNNARAPSENVLQTSVPSQVPEGLKTCFHCQALVNESPNRFRIAS
jgi:hypothetical protein